MAKHNPHSDQKMDPSVQPSGKVVAALEGHPAHAHEGTDVAIAPLVYSLVAFVVFAVVILGLTYAIFVATESAQKASQASQSGLKLRSEGPQEPRVQGIPGFHENAPSADMKLFSDRNRVMLENYVAAEEGRPARIPIERAMQLTMERKAFKMAAPASQPASGVPAPGAKPEGVPTETTTPKPAAPAEGAAK